MVRMMRPYLLLYIAAILISFTMYPHHKQSIFSKESITQASTRSQSLEEHAGFSSAELVALQQKGMQRISENIAITAYGHNYQILSFLPIGVTSGDGNRPDLGSAMLFQVDHKVGKLLWKKDVGSQWTILDAHQSEGLEWPTPGDWEENGQINFGVLNVADSSCPFHILNVYVLHSDGTVTERFKNMIPLDHIVSSVNIQDKGSLLLTTEDKRGVSMNSCVYPRMFRYYELKGKTLNNVSRKYQENYMNMLGEDIYFTTTWKPLPQLDDNSNSEWYSAWLMEILLIYDELGQRDVGYQLVQNLASNSLETGRVKSNTYLHQSFLPTMADLYRLNQPFIEPSYVGPNARQQHNYYP